MNEKRIQCPKHLDQESGRGLVEQIRSEGVAPRQTLVLDFSETEDMDTRGGAWLIELANYVKAQNADFDLAGPKGHVAEFLGLLRPSLVSMPETPPERPGVFEQAGEATLNTIGEFKEFYHFLVDTIYWTALAPFEGRGFRWGSFLDELHEMGVRALKITFLMNFLLGMIVAMLSAAQLQLFGASIYVADLVMVAFARELAAVMTAVVVSARTGAAIAAELATMKVQEELDALRGMGLHAAQFLVAPKVLALVIALPLLTGLGMLAGIGGGAVWGLVVLEFRPDIWFNQTLNAAMFSDIFQGFFKAFVFAIVIVLIGCHNGLRVTGGARGVGLMTTRAVVMDIFFIVFIDMIFAAFFYYIL